MSNLRERLEEIKAATKGHTPGPWSKPYYDCIPGDEGWWVHNGKEGSNEYAIGLTVACNPRTEKDAQLIAAAPDLLALATEAIEETERLRGAFEKFIDRVHRDCLAPDKLYIHESHARRALEGD